MNATTNANGQTPAYAEIAVAHGERLVPAKLQGVIVYIPCPAWCVKDHTAESFMFAEDLNHAGPEIAISVPTHGGGTEEALEAWLVQRPDSDDGRPYLAARSPSEDYAELNADEAAQLAEQVIAHGIALRKMAQQLAGLEV